VRIKIVHDLMAAFAHLPSAGDSGSVLGAR
jgi:hypothetical protein